MAVVRRTYRTRSRQKTVSARGISAAARFALGLILSGSGGCSSPPAFEFDDLDLVPAQEELTEFSLGEYRIPISLIDDQALNRPPQRNNLQLEFELFALVSPDEKWQIDDAWERHQGKIRDRVIRICRNASLDELQEPELATLKGQLMDALAPHLGQKGVRQLVIAEIVSQELASQSEQVAQAEHGESQEERKEH